MMASALIFDVIISVIKNIKKLPRNPWKYEKSIDTNVLCFGVKLDSGLNFSIRIIFPKAFITLLVWLRVIILNKLLKKYSELVFESEILWGYLILWKLWLKVVNIWMYFTFVRQKINYQNLKWKWRKSILKTQFCLS